MIDNTTIVKRQLSDIEANNIIIKNNLVSVVSNGKQAYNNNSKSNLAAFKISITPDKSIKIICSLHKFWNFQNNEKLINFNDFPMGNVSDTINLLADQIGINTDQLLIYGYEIGINLRLPKDCLSYLKQIKSIGEKGNSRQFYVNPKYKDERCLTTIFHRDKRKFYKIYDKCFEMKDKGRKDIPNANILRLESTFRRVENMPVELFKQDENLRRIQAQFFNEWNNLIFRRHLETPKGTTKQRKDLILDILESGTVKTLENAKANLISGAITEKQFRSTREFINHNWPTFKHDIKLSRSDLELEFLSELNRVKDIVSI